MGDRTGISWADATTAAAYLAGLVDGEGCVGFYRVGKRREIRRTICVSVCDVELVEAAARCYDQLGIPFYRSEHTPKNPKHSHVWRIEVQNQAGIERFAAVIRLQHRAKAEKLRHIALSFRVQTCSGCGCSWDDRTPACRRCTGRHKVRRRVARKRGK